MLQQTELIYQILFSAEWRICAVLVLGSEQSQGDPQAVCKFTLVALQSLSVWLLLVTLHHRDVLKVRITQGGVGSA